MGGMPPAKVHSHLKGPGSLLPHQEPPAPLSHPPSLCLPSSPIPHCHFFMPESCDSPPIGNTKGMRKCPILTFPCPSSMSTTG